MAPRRAGGDVASTAAEENQNTRRGYAKSGSVCANCGASISTLELAFQRLLSAVDGLRVALRPRASGGAR